MAPTGVRLLLGSDEGADEGAVEGSLYAEA